MAFNSCCLLQLRVWVTSILCICQWLTSLEKQILVSWSLSSGWEIQLRFQRTTALNSSTIVSMSSCLESITFSSHRYPWYMSAVLRRWITASAGRSRSWKSLIALCIMYDMKDVVESDQPLVINHPVRKSHHGRLIFKLTPASRERPHPGLGFRIKIWGSETNI